MQSTLHTAVSLSSLSPVKTDDLTRDSLKKYFLNTWELYELLFSSIKSEKSFYSNPDSLRHPLIFYWGHTAVFYVNKLLMSGFLEEGINPEFEVLFAVGVDPEKKSQLQSFEWPRLEEVNSYREEAKELILEAIEKMPLDLPVAEGDVAWAILMGIEHDRIHFETSSVLIRQYPEDLVQRPERWQIATYSDSFPDLEMISIKGGTTEIGKPKDFPTFGWDNEYGKDSRIVPDFSVSRNLITNGQYLEFVQDGGYETKAFWSEEGWSWKENARANHPRFWVKSDDGYDYRNMFDRMEMPMDWPAEVNAHEAIAYCSWLGNDARLLSESEWQLLADREIAKDDDVVFGSKYNINFCIGSPSPVGQVPPTNPNVPNDLFGNVWCWLSDDFHPLPGFEVHPWYENFSALYFDKHHAMLKGGAWATTGTGASKFYRLWFRRNFFQHAGFRIARSLS